MASSASSKPGPLLCIAHRGGRGLGTENTLNTIEQGLAQGADAIEIDVWQVGGQLLVTHDRYLGRVVAGRGRLLAVPAEQISRLRTVDGQPVATLQQVLDLVGDRARLNVEIKGPDCAPLVARQLLSHCKHRQLSIEQFVVSSFDHHQLYWLKQHQPQLLRGVLVAHMPLDGAQCCVALGAYSFHPNVDFVDAALVEDALKRQLKVWVYTVNEAEDFAELAAMGVEGVFTDFPQRVMAYNQSVS